MLTRRTFLASACAVPAAALSTGGFFGPPPRPRPTRDQLEWQRDERALFLHFGINTFTDREWGDGTEAPSVFNPTALDAHQWARVAKAAGFKALVLTAKHHDGFCLWPTRTTRHSVAASPWRGGAGDVVREFVSACRDAGLKAGLYLSPWDRHEPTYGDSARYNDFYADQLTELLTNYGPISEVWFDGANGEGPNGRRQTYDWPRTWGIVRRLQPHAVIFSDAGPDVRWIGNENGVAGDPNWSTVDPSVVPVPGMTGRAATLMLQHGDPSGTVWRPGETDVSIRPGWFHHDAETAKVRSADNLVGLFFTSVGRNSKLLLNVPPTRAGLIDSVDAERLSQLHGRLTALFANDLTRRHQWVEAPMPERVGRDVDLGRACRIGIAELREDISAGQWVSTFTIEALHPTGPDAFSPQLLAEGTTIGYRRLVRWPAVLTQRVRITVAGAPRPENVRVALFEGGDA